MKRRIRRKIRKTLRAVKAGRANRVLAIILALTLVLGMVSGAFSVDKITAGDVTKEAEIAVGDTVTYTADGDYTSASTSALDTDVATVSLAAKTVRADNGSYLLCYTRGSSTYYLTFSVGTDSTESSGSSTGTLTVGTVTSAGSATAVTYGTDYSLSFTQDSTTYYLNNTSGTALTADSSASTAWKYDTSNGFYCKISSTDGETTTTVKYYLASFIGYTTSSTSPGSAAPTGSAMISYAVAASGTYTLSFTENDTTKYIKLYYDSLATGYISTTVTTDSSDATVFTFDGSNITFEATEATATGSSQASEETVEDAGTVGEDAAGSTAADDAGDESANADESSDSDETVSEETTSDETSGSDSTAADDETSGSTSSTDGADSTENSNSSDNTDSTESTDSTASTDGTDSTDSSSDSTDSANGTDSSNTGSSDSTAGSGSTDDAGTSESSNTNAADSSSSEKETGADASADADEADADADSSAGDAASADSASDVSESGSENTDEDTAEDSGKDAGDGTTVSKSANKGLLAYAAKRLSAAFSVLFAKAASFAGGTAVQAAQTAADAEDTSTNTDAASDSDSDTDTAAAASDADTDTGEDISSADADTETETDAASDTVTETGEVKDAATVSEAAASDSESTTSTTYYLDINPNSGSGYLIAQDTSATRSYQAAWTYDPDEGFFCRKSYAWYLFVSAATTGSDTFYSLVISQNSAGTTTSSSSADDSGNTTTTSTTTSLLTANASADITFYLTYTPSGGSLTYLALSPDAGNLVSAASAQSGATVFTYTTDGHLCFTESSTTDDTTTSTTYYLALSGNEQALSVTTDKSSAVETAYKLMDGTDTYGTKWACGFTFTTTSGSAESDNLYLSGSPILAVSAQTTITFTGVAAGETSVTIGDVTYNITVYTKIITLEEGESFADALEGESSSFTAEAEDESIAAAALGDTTVSYKNTNVEQGSTEYILGYAASGVKYYFTFSCDGSTFTAGTTTYYYSGTGMTWDSSGYLSFTGSDSTTTYYLNVSSGTLTASTAGSTAWTYDSSTGFAVSSSDASYSSGTTLLGLLAALNPGGTVLMPFSTVDAGSDSTYTYTNSGSTLTYTDSGSTAQYLTFSVSSGVLSVSTTTTSGSGTIVTYTTDGYLSFTNSSDSTTYYLYVDTSGTSAGLAASSDSTDAAAWTYSPTNGLSCTISATDGSSGSASDTTYYLSGTSVSAAEGTSAVTFSADSLCFALGYEKSGLTYYVIPIGTTINGLATSLSSDYYKNNAKVTYTASGNLKTYGSRYLNLSSGKISLSSTASTAWTYDPENGFYYTDSDTTWYLTDFLTFTCDATAGSSQTQYAAAVRGYGKTTGTTGTTVTFTGVSVGETTATVTNSDSNITYTYKIIVTESTDTDEDTGSDDTSSGGTSSDGSSSSGTNSSGTAYVTTATSPFVGSSVGTATKNEETYNTVSGDADYADDPITGIYLSLGLEYGISVNVSTNSDDTTDEGTTNEGTTDGSSSDDSDSTGNGVTVSSGGTWTIADSSVATFAGVASKTNEDGSVSTTGSAVTTVEITGVSAGTTTLTYTVNGTSYTIPITIKDFWGYAGSSSTEIKVYEFYIAEVTDTTGYMAVLYGSSDSTVTNADFVKVTEGEAVYISFPYDAGTAVDFFGTPDEGYALTLLGSTNSASHYMALDTDTPGTTEFISLMTAAGYNQAYYFGSAAVFGATQAALDNGSDGGMGFTRPSSSYAKVASKIYIRSRPTAGVVKEIESITKTDDDGNTTTVPYYDGIHVSFGDVVNYKITVTQYVTAEGEEISYNSESLADTLSFLDSDGNVVKTATLTLADSSGSSSLELCDEAVESEIKYEYTTSYTVQEEDYYLTLSNYVGLSFGYSSAYSTSSAGQSSVVPFTIAMTRVVTETDDELVPGDDGYGEPEDTDDANETENTTDGSTDETTDESTDETANETGDTGETGNNTDNSDGGNTDESIDEGKTTGETTNDADGTDTDENDADDADDADADDEDDAEEDNADADDKDAADEDNADDEEADEDNVSSMSKTGDSTNIGSWIALLIAAAAAVIAVIAVRIWRGKRKK